ncbi:MAG: peptide ABC transporter substrate-binding protein [Woeseiaceae bacterium]|nr:peptide ABC transporter substrate-binding protein [Woeseiaceae bacterium]
MKPGQIYRAAVLVALFALAACARPDDGRVLVRGNGGDPGSLDPALAEDVHAFNVLGDLYEGLLRTGADGAIENGVASRWTVSEDGTTYTFELRDEERWSNGDVLVAADFVRAMRRVASPETPSAYAFLLQPIANFSAVKNGALPVHELGVSAPDERTLVIALEEPASQFLAALALPIAYPVHRTTVATSKSRDPGALVGNGAYVLARREPGGVIELHKNDLYRDAASVDIDAVRYLPIADANAELSMYRAGEIDITNTIPPSHIRTMREQRPDETHVAPALALYYLAFDLSEAPLDNQLLRHALSMAIDRNEIVELTGRGEQPAFSVIPPGTANHVAAVYDWSELPAGERQQLARSLLVAAGYSDPGTLSVKLTYDAGDIHERIALAVASMWRGVLGVEVRLEKLEWNLFLDTRARREDWQVMRFSWFGDYNDPMTFAEIFEAGHEQNLPGWSNARYDELLREARAESGLSARSQLLHTAERLLLDDYAIAPLYFYVSKHLVSPRVAGFRSNPLDRQPTRTLSIVDEL